MAENTTNPAGVGENDIVFECPQCSKSLVIDEQGAGLMVRCPDCGTRMQVPIPDGLRAEAADNGRTTAVDYTEAAPVDDVLKEKVERLQVTMEEVQQRKRYLEKVRIDNALRFERIREEMAIVQSALDRMVDVLQDIVAEKPVER